jgi:bifunctional non-homologous end joining protein LigD
VRKRVRPAPPPGNGRMSGTDFYVLGNGTMAAMAPRGGTPDLSDLSRYGRLAEYKRKRRFGITPEPPGGEPAARGPGPRQFVVQKHRAGHLHYDLRLEHRGVMLSWAVPKGPSLDPRVKRLAMETEPHPIDYNEFEGVIPEGEYGAGTVMIWDRGVWAPVVDDRLGDEADVDRMLARGELKCLLLGEKLKGGWVLVRTGRERQWLLIKHRDEYASEADLTLIRPRSVVSGRTMAEIARAAGASERQLAQAAAADPPPAEAAPAARPLSGGAPRSARPRRPSPRRTGSRARRGR